VRVVQAVDRRPVPGADPLAQQAEVFLELLPYFLRRLGHRSIPQSHELLELLELLLSQLDELLELLSPP
jgi:hypothetical protein